MSEPIAVDLDPGAVFALVRTFLTGLGVPSEDAKELIVDPWGVTVTTYCTNADGAHYVDAATSQAAVRRTHYPMYEVIGP